MNFVGFAWVRGFVFVGDVTNLILCTFIGPWSEHGTAWYSCNRFEEKAGVDARDAQSKSRASLERYLHVRILPNHLQPITLQTWLRFPVLQSLGQP